MTQREQQNRQMILDVARVRMMRNGIQKTTMSEIAQDLNWAVGTLYLYFKKKEELVLAIAEACKQTQTEWAQEIVNSSLPPALKIRQFILERYQFLETSKAENPHQSEFFKVLFHLNPAFIEEWQKRFIENLSQMLSEGQASGEFDFKTSAQEQAEIFALALRSCFPHPLNVFPLLPSQDELLRLVDWFLSVWELPNQNSKMGVPDETHDSYNKYICLQPQLMRANQ
ncbi:MAG: TetR/AcrR family transcriptional regulator [Cyanobacteria bacterium]|nr:TetR/AcrR family transcriptional regulator [Cyanobacteriota bacterium]